MGKLLTSHTAKGALTTSWGKGKIMQMILDRMLKTTLWTWSESATIDRFTLYTMYLKMILKKTYTKKYSNKICIKTNNSCKPLFTRLHAPFYRKHGSLHQESKTVTNSLSNYSHTLFCVGFCLVSHLSGFYPYQYDSCWPFDPFTPWSSCMANNVRECVCVCVVIYKGRYIRWRSGPC